MRSSYQSDRHFQNKPVILHISSVNLLDDAPDFSRNLENLSPTTFYGVHTSLIT
ncbi:hypothetical protein [Nostoc parmelioides]|uniref:hypothetical protein n=1 Tax=Nostoc parmelioides TaxID=1521621 RepID=UPI0016830F1B|nr:hypothetical protein [Nostoc parmelioides]